MKLGRSGQAARAAIIAAALAAAAVVWVIGVLREPLAGRTAGGASHSNRASGGARSSATAPPFLAGVVEGFYGPSWSVRNTLHMFRFMRQHDMNAFVYAPKNDPYERVDWQTLYPAAPWRTMRTLIAGAQTNGIHFVYSISPGLSITYSSQFDRTLLIRKINQLRAAGVNTFMLSFDDITGTLNHADTVRYGGNLAHAQSSLADYVWRTERAVDPQFRLLFAETMYFGTQDIPYWSGMKKYLSPAIEPIWTGPWVLSNSITDAQVRTVESAMGHRIVIWDNYPVNDFTYVIAHKPELFMGPLIGRGPGIPKLAAGYFFNPMLQARASEVALWTAADYLHDPAHYRPNASWDAALRAIGGPAYTALRLFAEDESSRYYDNLQPVLLARAAAAFWKQESVTRSLTATPLYRQFHAMAAVNAALAQRLPDHALYEEIAPFAKLLSFQGRLGMTAILAAQREKYGALSTTQVRQLRSGLAALARNPDVIAGTVTASFVANVLAHAGQ
ncbi:MAG: beta-N-acetylglucosaminidase domain-containing protein [Bacilli bacterium]